MSGSVGGWVFYFSRKNTNLKVVPWNSPVLVLIPEVLQNAVQQGVVVHYGYDHVQTAQYAHRMGLELSGIKVMTFYPLEELINGLRSLAEDAGRGGFGI